MHVSALSLSPSKNRLKLHEMSVCVKSKLVFTALGLPANVHLEDVTHCFAEQKWQPQSKTCKNWFHGHKQWHLLMLGQVPRTSKDATTKCNMTKTPFNYSRNSLQVACQRCTVAFVPN